MKRSKSRKFVQIFCLICSVIAFGIIVQDFPASADQRFGTKSQGLIDEAWLKTLLARTQIGSGASLVGVTSDGGHYWESGGYWYFQDKFGQKHPLDTKGSAGGIDFKNNEQLVVIREHHVKPTLLESAWPTRKTSLVINVIQARKQVEIEEPTFSKEIGSPSFGGSAFFDFANFKNGIQFLYKRHDKSTFFLVSDLISGKWEASEIDVNNKPGATDQNAVMGFIDRLDGSDDPLVYITSYFRDEFTLLELKQGKWNEIMKTTFPERPISEYARRHYTILPGLTFYEIAVDKFECGVRVAGNKPQNLGNFSVDKCFEVPFVGKTGIAYGWKVDNGTASLLWFDKASGRLGFRIIEDKSVSSVRIIKTADGLRIATHPGPGERGWDPSLWNIGTQHY